MAYYAINLMLLCSQARAEAGHAASSAKAAAQESLEAAEAAAVAAKEAAAAAAEQLSRPVVAAGRQIRRQAGNARDVAERAAHAGGAKVQTFYDIMASIVMSYIVTCDVGVLPRALKLWHNSPNCDTIPELVDLRRCSVRIRKL